MIRYVNSARMQSLHAPRRQAQDYGHSCNIWFLIHTS